tara:strand:- start:60 stop:1760 length:1701 start_codon:yes stop_codon:yes gene_type:complete
LISDAFGSILQGYIDGVMDGSIVTSRLVKCAIERHIRDLSKQSTQDFPYHFNAKLANRICRFYSNTLRHSVGRNAGMPFDLEPWQVFCEASIFGWLRDCDSTRRFRKTYESVGRKNGKSTRGAGRSIYMAGFDKNPKTNTAEPVAQVVQSATKRDQVDKVLFAEVERMRRKSPAITARSRFVKREIRFEGNDGLIMTTGSDKPYDGLNPHFVIMDELHAWREHHREFYDTMVTGSGFRDQPLISIITTAGDDRSYLWNEVYDFAKSVVSGIVRDDEFFVFVAELDEEDDPLDESNWIKANPNIGVSVSLDYLRQQAIEAANSPVALNRFTRYHGNRKVSSIEKAFDQAKWDSCAGTLSDWKYADAIGCGVDLGARDDLAAIGWCARFMTDERDGKPVYRYEVRTDVYIAEDTRRDLTKSPFFQWVYDDLIKRSRYPIADLRDKITETCDKNGCRMVAFDPYNGQMIAEELKQAGLEPFRMAQTHALFNEPIRDMMAAIDEKRLLHDGNELLRWAINNCVLYRDRKDNWMYDKAHSAEKIDPAVAITMAFRVASIIPARASGKLFIV